MSPKGKYTAACVLALILVIITFLLVYKPAVPTPSPTAAMVAEDWGYFPGPSVPLSIAVGPPASPIPQPEGQVNILLLGSDQRPGDYGFRTDTILLLTLNPNDGTANLTSFPRDLYVYIPGWTTQRINTAQAHFKSLNFSIISALGTEPMGARLSVDIVPRRILDPLLWIMEKSFPKTFWQRWFGY